MGREKELELLHQLLQGNHFVAIAAIAGMGGVGKTELALQYAFKQRQFYSGGICWCGVKSGNVGLQVLQFARIHLELNPLTDLDLVGQVAYCWQRWCEGNVLLVLDDVTKYKEIHPYLPPSSSRFKVLMTTRSHFGQIPKLSLDVLQPQAALELLGKLVGEKPVDLTHATCFNAGVSPLEQSGMERSCTKLLALQLCERLGYLPLGIELVGRYLARKEDLSLAEMLQRLEKKKLFERSLSQPEENMTAQQGVQTAFELSWQELNDADKQLACLLSLFAAAPIPWELVKQCLPNADAEELEESRDDKLVNLHLLQRKSKGIYQLHRLLREFFQGKLETPPLQESGGNFKKAFTTVIIAIAKYIPPTPTIKEITAVSPAMPHLAEVAKNFIEYISNEDLIWTFVAQGRFYKGQGLYAQAEPWFKQCLEVSKKRLGDNHPYVAQSLNNLAGLYKSQGRYDEAEPLYQQALQVMRHLRGEEHPYLAPTLDNLAELYRSQGRYDQAEPLYQQALRLRRHLLGKEYPAVAESLNNLALLYYYQGRYSEAEPLALRAIELDKQFLGEKYPDLATVIHNLALIYRAQGRYSEAEPLFLEALKLKQLLLPEDHPLLADTIYALGYMYRIQGCYTKAEAFSIKALELDKRLLGDNHPHVLQSLNNLAELYKSQGSYSQAEPLLQEALDIFERQLGVNHPHIITVRENLAILRAEISSQR